MSLALHRSSQVLLQDARTSHEKLAVVSSGAAVLGQALTASATRRARSSRGGSAGSSTSVIAAARQSASRKAPRAPTRIGLGPRRQGPLHSCPPLAINSLPYLQQLNASYAEAHRGARSCKRASSCAECYHLEHGALRPSRRLHSVNCCFVGACTAAAATTAEGGTAEDVRQPECCAEDRHGACGALDMWGICPDSQWTYSNATRGLRAGCC